MWAGTVDADGSAPGHLPGHLSYRPAATSHFNVCKRSKVPRLGLFAPVCSSFTDS